MVPLGAAALTKDGGRRRRTAAALTTDGGGADQGRRPGTAAGKARTRGDERGRDDMARVRGTTGAWTGKSNPAKVEIYTRWSFHSFAVVEVGVIGLVAGARTASPVGGWFLLLICAHAIVTATTSSYALTWALGRRARPVRLMVATAVVTAVGCVASLAVYPADPKNVEGATSIASLLVTFAGFGIGSLVIGVRRVRSMLLAVLATTVFVALAGLALGLSSGAVLGCVIGVVLAGLFLAFTTGFSVWLLRSVWELDSARELQARLAVAEERLRFGRDMHDVMGRNLAVIALKSELAEQLARRGGTEQAAEQMAEVQRIAQESQREVRAVVRGYREVDLHTELEGARGVLKAAGIRFRLDLDGVGAVGAGAGAGGAGGLAPVLASDVQSALGWVVREAATNVLRHGDARHCTVRLTVREGCDAVLVMENDGLPEQGVLGRAGAAGTPRTAGAGLAGLRERLATLGGTLDAGPVAGARFRLTARVPLPASPVRPGPPATPVDVPGSGSGPVSAPVSGSGPVSAPGSAPGTSDEVTA
ncbi:histidine kinase [Streptomyces sp. PSRA5]|uniref:histidine kinase n=1 Tax=Streptomyces panacea TaxID=3035064 RepID=UPI00339CB4C5